MQIAGGGSSDSSVNKYIQSDSKKKTPFLCYSFCV